MYEPRKAENRGCHFCGCVSIVVGGMLYCLDLDVFPATDGARILM